MNGKTTVTEAIPLQKKYSAGYEMKPLNDKQLHNYWYDDVMCVRVRVYIQLFVISVFMTMITCIQFILFSVVIWYYVIWGTFSVYSWLKNSPFNFMCNINLDRYKIVYSLNWVIQQKCLKLRLIGLNIFRIWKKNEEE